MLKKMSLLAVLSLTLICFMPLKAQDRVTRMHQFDLDGIDEIEINNAVGSIELNVVEGSELRVELELEGDREGFFRRRRDVGNVDLEIEENNDRLSLSIDDDDVTAHWTVFMPDVSLIDIDLGVGEINAEIGASSLQINVGVGDAEVEAPLEEIGDIHVSAGVGDARIRGVDNVDQSRQVVSEQSDARGEGIHDVDVEVGVGSAMVRLF